MAVTYLRAQISPSTPAIISTLNPSPSLLHASASPQSGFHPSSSSSAAAASLRPLRHGPLARRQPQLLLLLLRWKRPRGSPAQFPLPTRPGSTPSHRGRREGEPHGQAHAHGHLGDIKLSRAWQPVSHTQGWAGGKGERSDSREGHYCYYSIVII